MTDEAVKTTPPVDVTDTVPPMQLHKFIAVPQTDVSMTLKPSEVEFMFSTLSRVHATLMKTLTDPKTPEAEHKTAYDFAYNVELLYNSMFAQLKLYRTERIDLN